MADYQVVGQGEVVVGRNTRIGSGVKFIFHGVGKVTLGDYVTLGDDVKVIVESGEVAIDDWTTLHPDCLVLCKQGVTIGQHCWFGQNSVLDGTGGLRIGNGVRVGMYSQIWSHIAAGEQIEGCKFFSADPVEICDDVWLVGSCTVGSGVTIGRRAVCLSGSNVTRSVPENVLVAGMPAKVKEGIQAYAAITLDQKFALMLPWIEEFCAAAAGEFFVSAAGPELLEIGSRDSGSMRVFKYTADYLGFDAPVGTSAICIENKKYSKNFTPIEGRLLRFLSGNKARFYRH